MSIFQSRRKQEPSDQNGAPAASLGNTNEPIDGYDQLDEKKVGARLHELTQVQLAAVEEYERSNRNRNGVLAKLRYMRMDEPLEGYDEMSPEQISEALAGSDARLVKAVRDYERKFAGRRAVMDEVARVLPQSPANAAEAKAQAEKDERVRGAIQAKGRGEEPLA